MLDDQFSTGIIDRDNHSVLRAKHHYDGRGDGRLCSVQSREMRQWTLNVQHTSVGTRPVGEMRKHVCIYNDCQPSYERSADCPVEYVHANELRGGGFTGNYTLGPYHTHCFARLFLGFYYCNAVGKDRSRDGLSRSERPGAVPRWLYAT